jgi:hypothetical protein
MKYCVNHTGLQYCVLITLQTLFIDNKKARAQNGDILSENCIPSPFSNALKIGMEKMKAAAAAVTAAVLGPSADAGAPVLVAATAAEDLADADANAGTSGPAVCKL